ncbi:MAG: phospholipase D-like domain-containing protein [Halapricum sp.]
MRRLVPLLVLAVLALPAAGIAPPTVVTAGDATKPPTGEDVPVSLSNTAPVSNGTAPVPSVNGTSTTPSITAVYPNPIAYGDPGEYVALSVPEDTDLEAYRLSDDHGSTELPNRTVGDRVVLTANRSAVVETVPGPVLEVSGFPTLANNGETLALTGPAGTVDTVEYSDAPEGDVFRPDGDRRWRPLGATDFEPTVGEGESVRAFALPDSSGVPLDVVEDADKRILLAGYTYTSQRVTEALIDAQRRGVDVEVLADGAPVGGLTNRSATALDRLVGANVSVRVVGGEGARYEFHHPKYAVADDKAVVLTENWKPAGVGGASSRGWGAVVDSPAVVDGLSRTFRADAGGRDAIPWEYFRRGESFEPSQPSRGRYPARIDPEAVSVERTELLVAPDNAAGRVRRLLANATESIRVVQVSIGGREDQLLEETIEAARRGVEIEILLSGAWYTRADNRRVADYLRGVAAREGLPLSVRLADPGGRYEKIHAKGVVVDGDTVVLGSLNWNDNAYYDNREVALVLYGEQAGAYFESVFERDWHGGITRVSVGLLAVVVLALVLTGMVVRRIEFAG